MNWGLLSHVLSPYVAWRFFSLPALFLFVCFWVFGVFWGGQLWGNCFFFCFVARQLLRISVYSVHSFHPRRAQCAPGVFKQQPEGNTWPAKGSWQSAALPPLGRLLTVLANGHAVVQASPTTPVKPSTCSSRCLPHSSITTQAPSKGLCSAHYLPRDTLKTSGRLTNSKFLFWKPTKLKTVKREKTLFFFIRRISGRSLCIHLFASSFSHWPGAASPGPEQGHDCRWPSWPGKREGGSRLRGEGGINKSLVKEAGLCGGRRSHSVFRLLWNNKKK